MGRVGAALARRAAFAALVFAAGMAAGYGLKLSRTVEAPDKQIRPGRVGFTNPLFDCEVEAYAGGRELPPFKEELEDLVGRLIARGEAASVALYFRDLDNGPWVGIDEERPFTPASLLKVPLLMACFMQEDHDPGFLRSEIRFRGVPEEGGVSSFTADVPLVVGRTYTVEDLIEQVAVYSDNQAAVLLYGLVNKQLLQRVYRDMGFDPGLVRDPVKRAEISPKAFGRLFRVLYNASYLNREKSERLLALMSRAEFHDGLVAGAPPDAIVSHKFGVVAGLSPDGQGVQLHDCGIVYGARRPYFLCVMTQGADVKSLAGVIGQISRFVSGVVESPLPEVVPASPR